MWRLSPSKETAKESAARARNRGAAKPANSQLRRLIRETREGSDIREECPSCRSVLHGRTAPEKQLQAKRRIRGDRTRATAWGWPAGRRPKWLRHRKRPGAGHIGIRRSCERPGYRRGGRVRTYSTHASSTYCP